MKDTAKTEALSLLHRGVTDHMTSDGWRRALEFRSRFHAYSFFSASLILAQKPERANEKVLDAAVNVDADNASPARLSRLAWLAQR